jgi:hypothetical protein
MKIAQNTDNSLDNKVDPADEFERMTRNGKHGGD